MLNIQINKLLKMDGFFGFGGGAKKSERAEMRSDLKNSESLWRGDSQPADIEFIKDKQKAILDIVEQSKNPNLTQIQITNLGIEKMKLIKERNAEANKLPQIKRDELSQEIGAYFDVIN